MIYSRSHGWSSVYPIRENDAILAISFWHAFLRQIETVIPNGKWLVAGVVCLIFIHLPGK